MCLGIRGGSFAPPATARLPGVYRCASALGSACRKFSPQVFSPHIRAAIYSFMGGPIWGEKYEFSLSPPRLGRRLAPVRLACRATCDFMNALACRLASGGRRRQSSTVEPANHGPAGGHERSEVFAALQTQCVIRTGSRGYDDEQGKGEPPCDGE